MTESVKFLLVDDVNENLVALSALLARPGLGLLCARSGVEALELLLQHDFALALVDVHMPDMDGFELAELMRGSERSKRVPIIFATASSNEQQRVFKGYESGAVDFLFKPIDPHILKHKADVFFQLALQRHQLARQVEEREGLLREVRETLRLNEMFTAALSHDLRTPLSAIAAGAALLCETAQDPRSQRVGQRLTSSAARMAEMIEQLLDLSRARLAGGIPITRSALDLRLLAEKIIAEAHVAAAGGRVLLEVTGDSSGAWDAGRLEQVLSNLVSNALRHGRPGGPVRVRIEGEHEHQVQVSVQNDGAIPAGDLPSLFDPFRGSGTQVRSKEGLGLGLYIVDQIVKAHGGEVSVRSSEQEGTCFSVVLPRIVGPAA